MDTGAYSYIPSNTIEDENQSSMEFDDNMKAIMIRMLVISLSFFFGFKLMQYLTRIYQFFFPPANPWKTKESSSAITEDKGITQKEDKVATKKNAKEKKTK